MYLIRVKARGSIALYDDGVLLIPEFKKIIESPSYGEDYLKAIALYLDYQSPFRFRAEGKERRSKIAAAVFGEQEIPKWEGKDMKAARKAYSYLQQDPIRNHLQALEEQLKDFDNILKKKSKDVDDIQKKLKAMKEIKVLRTQISEVRDEVTDSLQEIKIKGNKIQSWLEERLFHEEQINKLEK